MQRLGILGGGKDDDVYNSMALIISSSQNSPDVLKQDKVETSLKGKVNQEPGGMIPQEVVIIDSGGPKPDSLFLYKFEHQ